MICCGDFERITLCIKATIELDIGNRVEHDMLVCIALRLKSPLINRTNSICHEIEKSMGLRI